MIEEIERLETQFEAAAGVERNALNERQVEVLDAGPIEETPR